MKYTIPLLAITLLFSNCNKEQFQEPGCDLQKAYADNAAKLTLANAVWGTVSFMEGNCMPMLPPARSSCKNCPVKRTVKIYDYTLLQQATLSANSNAFFDRFNTRLVAEADTDDNGFFQIDIPAGTYSLAILENGKLYANGFDGQGGIQPFNFTGGTLNVNVTMTYKAVF